MPKRSNKEALGSGSRMINPKKIKSGSENSGVMNWITKSVKDKKGEVTETFHWDFTNITEEMEMRCGQCFTRVKHGPICKSTTMESDDIFIGRGTGTLSKWLIVILQAHRKFSVYLEYRGLFSEATGKQLPEDEQGFPYRSETTVTAGEENNVLYTTQDGVFTLKNVRGDVSTTSTSHKGVINLGAMFKRGSYGAFKYENMNVSVKTTKIQDPNCVLDKDGKKTNIKVDAD